MNLQFESLAQRLIRMGPPDYGFHMERPDIASIDDALAWLHDQPWGIDTDAERRQFVKRLLWLRWLHSADWQKRGGVNA